MYFPTYHTHKFYNDPHQVYEWANSLEYIRPEEGNYPGARTKQIHEIDEDFFQYTCNKVLQMIYGKNASDVTYQCTMNFQRIKYDDIAEDGKGWVHLDDRSHLTVLIYLTPGKTQSGTSLFMPKKEGTILEGKQEEKFKYYRTGQATDQYKHALDYNNSLYEEIATFGSNFNSMVAFDGGMFHGANFDLKPGEERLTQTLFFNDMRVPYYPGVEMERNTL